MNVYLRGHTLHVTLYPLQFADDLHNAPNEGFSQHLRGARLLWPQFNSVLWKESFDNDTGHPISSGDIVKMNGP